MPTGKVRKTVHWGGEKELGGERREPGVCTQEAAAGRATCSSLLFQQRQVVPSQGAGLR